MKNILISCAGRRVELVQAFQEQVRRKSLSSQVHASDSNPDLSSACQSADVSARLPRISCPEYAENLKVYCQRNSIGLIIPTIDTELSLLAEVQEDFRKSRIEVVISDQAFVSACGDKRITGELFIGAGIKYPEVYDVHTAKLPCFAKPYDGSAGFGARVIRSRAGLGSELLDNPKTMFMELIPDAFCEYTVDAYFDRDSNLKCAVPRKRLEVRSGEVSKGVTKKNFVFEKISRVFDSCAGARGCITIQIFVNETTQEIVGLEINPRFGGGFPLSYSAGANFPGWLIDEYFFDKELSVFDSWEDRLMMLRYDAKVLVSNSDA